MVPSGGLLRAKMAPAGAQMGSGNLINAGTVSEGRRESEKRVKIHAGVRKNVRSKVRKRKSE